MVPDTPTPPRSAEMVRLVDADQVKRDIEDNYLTQKAFVRAYQASQKKKRSTSLGTMSRFLKGEPVSYGMARGILTFLYKDQWKKANWHHWLEKADDDEAVDTSSENDTEALATAEPLAPVAPSPQPLDDVQEQYIDLTRTLDTSGIPRDLPVMDVAPVGREKTLEKIHRHLQQNNQHVLITGMPGVGKSVVALFYAYHYLTAYPGGAFWIDANDDDIAQQIVDTAIAQGLTVPDTIELSKQMRYALNHWPAELGDVLLILDNVDDETALQSCMRWFSNPRFKLLVTARSYLQIARIERIHLAVLDSSAAIAVVREQLREGDNRLVNYQDALELCTTLLGGLPLALAVVGQVLRNNPYMEITALNESLRTTRNLFAGDTVVNLDMADMLDSVRRGILAAFELSWNTLPAECKMLAVLISTFEPLQLPWPLIQRTVEQLPDFPNPAAPCATLQRMSLLRRTGKNTVKMHQLLRGFFNLKMRDEQFALRNASHQALLALCEQLPARCTALQAQEFVLLEPHVIAAIQRGQYDEELYEALQCYFLGRGLYRQAYKWSEGALDRFRHVEGNPVKLAYQLKQAGERAHLAALYEDAIIHLEEARRLLHSDENSKLMAQVLVVLSATQRDMGQLNRAESTSQKALDLCRQYFDLDAPEITEAGMTLATLKYIKLRQQTSAPNPGNLKALEKQVEGIIAAREQHQIEDKSAIAESLNLLAKIYEAQDKNNDAIVLYRRAVALTEPPHIDAAKARNNLAKALEPVADEHEVIALYHEAIGIFEDADQFGDQGWSMKNLGMYYASQGRQEEGIAMVEQACSLLKTIQDPRLSLCEDSLNSIVNHAT